MTFRQSIVMTSSVRGMRIDVSSDWPDVKTVPPSLAMALSKTQTIKPLQRNGM
jgi:hypothetical protein